MDLESKKGFWVKDTSLIISSVLLEVQAMGEG